MPVNPDTAFDWYIPHLYQSSTRFTKVAPITVFEASEVFVMLLVKFTSQLMKKLLTHMFLVHSMKK